MVEIIYKGQDFKKASGQELRKCVQKCRLFQDPYASLNPRMTIGEIIEEPLKIQKRFASKEEMRAMFRGDGGRRFNRNITTVILMSSPAASARESVSQEPLY